MTHEMQHTDNPTWCVRCGTFDTHCAATPCIADSAVPQNFARMFHETFGTRVAG